MAIALKRKWEDILEYNGPCPIWGTAATLESLGKISESKVLWVSGFNVNSDRAGGRYSVEKAAYDILGSSSTDEDTKIKLTTWLCGQRAIGVSNPNVTPEMINFVRKSKSISVHARADKLLQLIASKSVSLGHQFHFFPSVETVSSETNEVFMMLATTDSRSNNEIVYLLDYLKESNFLSEGSQTVGRLTYIITPKGFAHLAELEKKHTNSVQGFVAMWFNEATKSVYENGFEKAIISAGYSPLRIDRKNHNNKIDDEIVAEIRRSKFVVADFTHDETGARGGVYYEAGFAHGLGIEVIFTCHEDSFERTHFDTRQYNHIIWKTADDLSVSLANRISATIGDGPNFVGREKKIFNNLA